MVNAPLQNTATVAVSGDLDAVRRDGVVDELHARGSVCQFV